jgi:DNA-binding transcriptional ArsR family regulator
MSKSSIAGEICFIIALDPNGRAMMTRDMELIRRILLEIQARKDLGPFQIKFDDVDVVTLSRHLEMLVDAGLVEGIVSKSLNRGFPVVAVTDLSWAGHEFISPLENDSVWAKIKESFSPAQLAAMPLAAMQQVGVGLAVAWAKQKVGL